MKPPIHHPFFFRPTTSSISITEKNAHKSSSLHSLVSHLLSLDSPKLEPTTNIPLLDSSKHPKPISRNPCYDLIPPQNPQINDFSNTHLLNSIIPSPKCPNNETCLFHSSNKQKPITISPKFIQTRSFSSSPQDPSHKPLESKEPDSIDAGSSNRKPIGLWPGMFHSPATNALWEARVSYLERIANVSIDGLTQSELVKKTPSQSRTSILYRFSSDDVLREQYRNPWNELRMGKLLEDLDALAGTISLKKISMGKQKHKGSGFWVPLNIVKLERLVQSKVVVWKLLEDLDALAGTISLKHCSNDDSTTRPVLLVTASVDKMVLKKPIRVDTDLKIVGSVTWVGRSSMEIQLEVNQSTEETSNSADALALIANFTFVARDPKTGRSAPINQISPETEKERLLWEEAEERNTMRRKKRGEQKNKEIESGEIDRLNELLAEGRVFSDMPALADRDSILMKDTCHQNSLICQPQQRNIHGRIFGGFLMRRAFELGFATAYAFAGNAPCFVEVDHVDFLKPVDVGNFLRFKSCVLYTELENPSRPLINVEVVAHVTRPELRSSEVSNKFYFTFTVRSEAVTSGMKIRSVVPATEEEARRVIERMDAESSS
ncbi:hypothetical protein LguiA_002507 [Lonicera macranthoides]